MYPPLHLPLTLASEVRIWSARAIAPTLCLIGKARGSAPVGFVTDAIDSAIDTVAGIANGALSFAAAVGVPGAVQAQKILNIAVEVFKPDADAYGESSDSYEERRKKLIDDVREKIPEFVERLRAEGVDIKDYETPSDYDSFQEVDELRDVFDEISDNESVPEDVRAEAKKIVESFDDALYGSTV
jgi:hypothetical protein